jgi:hypothetical protein
VTTEAAELVATLQAIRDQLALIHAAITTLVDVASEAVGPPSYRHRD